MPNTVYNPLSGNFDLVIDDAAEVLYNPADPTDWPSPAPGTTAEALDSLADKAFIEVKDEAISLTSSVTSITFAGAGVTASAVGNDVTVTIPSGSAGTTEIFNTTVVIGASAATLTGLLHFKAPSSLTISSVVVQLFEKNGVSSGTLEVDIKKNTTPDNVGMTSIFSVKPSFNFAVVADYATSSGTISTSSVSSGDYLRLDITSIPSGFLGNIQVIAYA